MQVSNLLCLLGCVLIHEVTSDRPNPARTNHHANRLSPHLANQGRLRLFQWLNDEDELDDGRDSRDHHGGMQGDMPQLQTMDSEDPEILRHICCTLGRAQAISGQNCHVRQYIRLARESLQQQESLDMDIHGNHGNHGDQGQTYRCVLSQRNSFTKCCHTAKKSHRDHQARRLHRHHSS